MRIGVVGINHKLADLKLREGLAKACQKWFGAMQTIHTQHSFILLSTCNRTEVYFSSQDLAATHSYLLNVLRSEVEEEFDHKLYSFFGIDCFCHLAKVTLGLDSAIIGETEIQGQVKVAYENAIECRSLPKVLHFLFQKSLGISKKLRSELQLGRGMPNLEDAILQTGKHLFHTPQEARLLFVGASEINRKILIFLKNKKFQNISLCNRSDEQAQAFSEEYRVHHLNWSKLKHWYEYDWIIFGTKSPEYLISSKELNGCAFGKKLVLDLCVPRNVDPKLSFDPRLVLLNIDQINSSLNMRTTQMTRDLEEAEQRVIQESLQQAARYEVKSAKKIELFAYSA